MASLVDNLNVLLSDTVSMYFQAHGYHWNVEGPDFSQYHSLFGDVYEDVYGSIDPVAENIRKLGEYAPFTLSKFSDMTNVDIADVDPNPKAMVKALIKSNDVVLSSIDTALKSAMDENEQGIANFLAERDDMHKKWRWQLTASIK